MSAGQAYLRLSTAPIDEVLGHVRAAMERSAQGGASRAGGRSKAKVQVSGAMVKVGSLRLRVFAVHGTVCSCCGLPATRFAIEKPANSVVLGEGWHLNLYGVAPDGRDVLFTHDHTHARGLGGADSIENTTTMCSPCNASKSLAESAECLRRDRCFVLLDRRSRAPMTDPETGLPCLEATIEDARARLASLSAQGLPSSDWTIDTHANWRQGAKG